MSAAEVAKKYGLHSPNIISVWRNRYVNSEKSINFAPENDTKVVEETCMVDKSKAELEAELAKVKKELEWSRLEKKALEVLIEVAEKKWHQYQKKNLGPSSRKSLQARKPVSQSRLQAVWPLQIGLLSTKRAYRWAY